MVICVPGDEVAGPRYRSLRKKVIFAGHAEFSL